MRNEDCVDDATTNMENGKNNSHSSLMMNSDVNSKHPALAESWLLRKRSPSEYAAKGKYRGTVPL